MQKIFILQFFYKLNYLSYLFMYAFIYMPPERPILRQISSLMCPKIQRTQVIMNVVNCPAFRSTEHYREYEDPVLMEFDLVRYPRLSPQVSVNTLHC